MGSKTLKFKVGDRVIHSIGYPVKKSGVVTFANQGSQSYSVRHDDDTFAGAVREHALEPETTE